MLCSVFCNDVLCCVAFCVLCNVFVTGFSLCNVLCDVFCIMQVLCNVLAPLWKNMIFINVGSDSVQALRTVGLNKVYSRPCTN